MQISEMIRDLDSQIAKLQKARQSLAEVENSGVKESTRKVVSRSNTPAKPIQIPVLQVTRKPMSAKTKKKLADAARKRWAEKRKITPAIVKLSK
jgi:hypothetical protein